LFEAEITKSGYLGVVASDGIRALAARQLKRRSRLRAKRQIDALHERLEDGERVLHLATASRGTAVNLLAATDRRLLVLRSGTREDEGLTYDSMRSLAASRERLGSRLEIRTENREVVLDGIHDQFDEICRLVHARMWEASVERLGDHARVKPHTLIGRASFA
jgi:methylthioribose-1-phosphate isomerase